jgi:hypothetical protein
MSVQKTCCWGSTKALHMHKSDTFPPNINRVATSHLAEDLTDVRGAIASCAATRHLLWQESWSTRHLL